MTSPFTLAVCAEMVFLDLSIVERVRRIHELGFQVEIWDWTTQDIDALVATGATFSSMTGYVRGELVDPDGADELLATAAASIPVARGWASRASTSTAPGSTPRPAGATRAEVTGEMWLRRARTLARIADLGERQDVCSCLENLNTAVDHPGSPFATAADMPGARRRRSTTRTCG